MARNKIANDEDAKRIFSTVRLDDQKHTDAKPSDIVVAVLVGFIRDNMTPM